MQLSGWESHLTCPRESTDGFFDEYLLPVITTATPTPTKVPDIAENFAALFEESLSRKEMRAGEVITAEVVRVDPNFVVVNAGLKSESYIPIEEFKNDRGELEVQPGEFVSGRDRGARRRLRRNPPVAREGQAPGGLARARSRAGAGHRGPGAGQRQGQGRAHRHDQRHPRVPAGVAGRSASGQGHQSLRGQAARVQGHQARPQAQQRRGVAPRRARGLRWRGAPEAARDAAGRRRWSRAWSRTSPTTARSWIWAASTACCTSPTWRGAA